MLALYLSLSFIFTLSFAHFYTCSLLICDWRRIGSVDVFQVKRKKRLLFYKPLLNSICVWRHRRWRRRHLNIGYRIIDTL